VTREDLDLIEQCVHALSGFAVSPYPMAMPEIYSKAHHKEEELWQRWEQDGKQLIELSRMIAQLKDIAARAGAVWQLECHIAGGDGGERSPPKPDVLLVTVNRHETCAVLDAFQLATGIPAGTVQLHDRIYHDLGVVNGTSVYHAISEMGSGGAGGMQQTVDKAIRSLNPGAVIAVGIAFGICEGKQSIGDLLISKQLRPYELQRVGNSILLRGPRPDAATRLVNHFRSFSDARWNGAEVSFGVLLSGEKLIDEIDYRKDLQALEPEAIGGEMEGAGLYVSGNEHKVDWIVVKAICDFADGNKGAQKTEKQKLAANNAAEFVLQALQYAPLKRR
jgi:nucleoside phosphorylase